MKQEKTDGAIFVFYDDNGKFRFSFIQADYNGIKQSFTSFRRYSYFIDKNQTNRTFIERFGGAEKFDSLDDILQAFSVEPLNKEFYGRIQTHFDKLKDNKHNNEFSVRLIGRLLFCWFLKKRQSDNHQPLIPDNLLAKNSVSNNYYQNIIEPLFFDTLNTPIKDRKNNKLKNHATIPYLNGGLFEKQSDDNTSVSDEWFTEFFATLEQYNFTVDENSSTDTEVGIDPEMLGTIFENLLAEQDPDTGKSARKSSGSFYTPRPIVDYMVEQSLTAYLQQQTEIDESRILSLFTDKEVKIIDDKDEKLENNQIKFSHKEQEQLLHALFNLKILDPACGSGAFPVGVMQKMLSVLRHLDGDGKLWRAKHKSQIIGKSQEAQKLRNRLEQSDADYIHKLGIISRCIYGVDIQPIATEIAKLRCFLSLIIDETIDDNADNRGIEPLPNLEFKFVTANTLLDLPKVPKDNKEIQLLVKNFDDLRSKYLHSFGKNKNDAKNSFENLHQKYFGSIQMSYSENTDKLFEQLEKWQPFNSSAVSPWFDPKWMFGVDEFDIVIGNPPYAQVKKKTYCKNTFPYSEGKDKGKQNLYKLFIEYGYNTVKDKGTVCLIVQSSLLCDLSSQYTRELLLTKTKIDKIIEFPKLPDKTEDKVFSSIMQGTCITLFSKEKPINNAKFNLSVGNSRSTINNLSFEQLEQQAPIKIYPLGFFIPLVNINEINTLEKILKTSHQFKKYIKSIMQGDLNLTTHKKEIRENNTGVHLLRGKHIEKYGIDYFSNEYISKNFKITQVQENKNKVFLVCQEVTGTVDKYRLHFSLTDTSETFLFGHTANKILLNSDDNNRYILGLLNSKLLDWVFRKTSSNNHVGGYEIEQLPIRFSNKELTQLLTNKVSKIINLVQSNNYEQVSILQDKIDTLVYHIYDLNYEEVCIINPLFNMTKKEYDNFLENIRHSQLLKLQN